MAAPRKYGPEIRQAIHELVNEQGKPATEAHITLEAEHGDVPVVERIREIAREERAAHRPDLTQRPKAEQLQHLIAGVVKAVHTELYRIEHAREPVDADQLLKLARTIREVEPLLKPDTSNHDANNQPQGLLGQLGGTQPRQPRNPSQPNADAVRSGVAPQELEESPAVAA